MFGCRDCGSHFLDESPDNICPHCGGDAITDLNY